MLTLAAAGTIQGFTTATATAVTYTIFGDEVSSGGADAFKVLAQGQLATAAAALYTVPASTSTLIKSMQFVNTTGNGVTITVYVNGTANANSIGTMVIPANGQVVWTPAAGWQARDANASIVQTIVPLVSTNPKDIGGTAYITSGNPQGWAGADFGAWMNSAYAYLIATYGTTAAGPPSGFTGAGRIQIGPGVYTFTTPIVCADQWFSIDIRGSGEGMALTPAANSGKGGTVLNYTPTSGIALTLAGASSNDGGVHISDLALFGGTVGTVAAVPGGTAVGIQWGLTGGSPPPGSSTAGATATNVTIAQFATGEVWNASGSVGYAVTHINCKTQFCANGVQPSGEANTWYGGLIGNCTTGVLGNVNGTDANFIGTAFDDNTTTAINISQPLFRSTLTGVRFENAGGGTETYITQSNGAITIHGGSMQTDAATGTSTGFVQATGGVFQLSGTWLYSGGRTMTQCFNVSSAVTSFKADPVVSPSATGISQLFNVATSVFPRGTEWSPQCNVTSTALTTTTATNVDSRGGLPCPANIRPGFRARCTIHILASATGVLAHTLSVRYGTANANTDTAIFSTSVGGTVTAVAASGQYVIDVHIESATLAWAYVQTLISNVGALGNANQDLGPATQTTISTTAASFLGVYLAAGTANALTIKSVNWEILST